MGRRGAVIRKRLIAIAVFMGLWGIAIGTRLYSLQVVQSEDFKDRAERQQQRVIDISPRRGAIYDRHGNELAVSIEVNSLYAVPSEVVDPARTAALLSEILEVPTPSLKSRLDSERSFAWLERKITARQAARIRTADIDGLYFQKEAKRFYPNRELAAHVLGFVNIDGQGGSGIEYRYDDLINGTPGKAVLLRDARGRSFNRIEQAPTIGASLTTTIDQNIQYIVEKEIVRTIQETGAVGMSVIVMDPNNGEILAMGNYPQFNPNEYGRFPERSWSNRAISHIYEPGSTFKIVTAAGALEEELTYLDELIDCQMGSIDLFGHRIRDHKAFGILSVREIMKYSSDVGIIKLGMRLGDERFASYIHRLGFGRRTGIDLPGEERGLTKEASDWSRVSVGAISMGQEIGTTALQIVNMVSAVANGGILYRPFVVQSIDDPTEGTTRETAPGGERVMFPETAYRLQEALTGVVTGGTAQRAQMSRYSAAGKTGTAQKLDPSTGTYSLTKFVASFAGYAPIQAPAVSAIVVIDEPQGADHGGGVVAAPVFKRIVEQVLRYQSATPDLSGPAPGYTEDSDETLPLRQPPVRADDAMLSPWAVVDTSLGEGLGFPAASLAQNALDEYALVRFPVPSFYGKSLRQVTHDTLGLGLRLQSGGSGAAVAQAPAPGTLVPVGARVQVWFSTSTSPREPAEPDSPHP